MPSAPTTSDVRAPNASRAHTSRPSVSVPSGWAALGGSGPWYDVTTMAWGGCGVGWGAAAPPAPAPAASATPVQRSQRPGAPPGGPSGRASAMLHSGIDDAVEQVDDQFAGQDEHRREEHRS